MVGRPGSGSSSGAAGVRAKPGAAFAGIVAPAVAAPKIDRATTVFVIVPRNLEAVTQVIVPPIHADRERCAPRYSISLLHRGQIR